MKLLRIAYKTLLEYVREPLLLALLFLFPILLLAIFYLAVGQGNAGTAHYLTVAVLNEDGDGGAVLVDALRDLRFEGLPVLDVSLIDAVDQAEAVLREHKLMLLVRIPAGLGRAIEFAASGQAATPVEVEIVGDPFSDMALLARSYVLGVIRAMQAGTAASADEVRYEFAAGTGTMSDFDFSVGGIMIFGVMFTTVTTAHVLVREEVSGTLRRLRLASVRARDLLGGVTLAQAVIAAVVVPTAFGVAALLGFRSQGSLLAAILVGIILSLSAAGLGLLTACFTHSDGEAANLGAGVMVPLVLLSGTFFPMPAAPLLTIAGRTIEVYDVLPTAHAAEALRRVLVGGEGIGAVGFELAAMTVLSVLVLGLGVVLYHRLRLQPN